MPSQTVAIVSPGDMGHNLGKALKKEGLRIVTCLAGRSDRTRSLAADAGFEDAPSLAAMMTEADLVLSIVPPSSALDAARGFADAMTSAGATPPYADCNAVSPQTALAVGEVVAGAGAPFIDAGIVGPGLGTREKPTRFYVSGPQAPAMAVLQGPHIDVVDMGPEIGRASAIKMSYAAVTKGVWTLYCAALMSAEALGVTENLHEELAYSRPGDYAEMERMVPRLPLDARRWIGEMREIAATLQSAGVSPNFHKGAADVFELLERTPIAQETRQTVDTGRTLKQALKVYAEFLPKDRTR